MRSIRNTTCGVGLRNPAPVNIIESNERQVRRRFIVDSSSFAIIEILPAHMLTLTTPHTHKESSSHNAVRPKDLEQMISTVTRKNFSLFLQGATVVAHSVEDLELLHTILRALEDEAPHHLKHEAGYQLLQSLQLPNFFTHPGPIFRRRTLELRLLDFCKNLTKLTIGISAETLTQLVHTESEAWMPLRELKSLDDVLDTYGIPHIYNCQHLTRLHLDYVDDTFIYRNCVDEPMRVFVSVATFLSEGFSMQYRYDLQVITGVRCGRFSDECEELPAGVLPLDDPQSGPGETGDSPRFMRHSRFMDALWARGSRMKIQNPWSRALGRGVDRPEVEFPGQEYEP